MIVPGPLSVYRFCSAITDLMTGHLYLTDPVPFAFVEREDTILHVVTEGESWATIAARYYDGITGISSGAQLWRVVLEFQPVIPMDSTVPPLPGSVVYVPGERTLLEEVFSEARRPDYEA